MKKAIMVAVVAFAFLLGACGADAIETEVKANTTNGFELEWVDSCFRNPRGTFLVERSGNKTARRFAVGFVGAFCFMALEIMQVW